MTNETPTQEEIIETIADKLYWELQSLGVGLEDMNADFGGAVKDWSVCRELAKTALQAMLELSPKLIDGYKEDRDNAM